MHGANGAVSKGGGGVRAGAAALVEDRTGGHVRFAGAIERGWMAQSSGFGALSPARRQGDGLLAGDRRRGAARTGRGRGRNSDRWAGIGDMMIILWCDLG